MTEPKTTLGEYAAAIAQMSYQLASGFSEAATRFSERVAAEGGALVVSETRKFELLAAELGAEFRAAATRATNSAEAARLAGNEALARGFERATRRHSQVADQLLNSLVNKKAALDALAADAKATAANADAALGGTIVKRIGPAFDAMQMVQGAFALAQDTSNGDKLGGASMGVVLSWLLGSLGAVAGVGLGLPAVGVAVLAGLGAIAGSALGDPLFGALRDAVNDYFNGAGNWRPAVDPLMLDLDGDGLELQSASGTVLFDHDADGIKTGTGWIGSDDGILVRDINGDGRINSGREFFGVNTIKRNGEAASNGFDALADLDDNEDGSFTALDLAWSQVKIWRDLNQDGVSDANELFGLDQLGISRIGVVGSATNATGGSQAGITVNGNLIAQSASFTRNGVTRAVGSVNLSAGAVDLGSNNFHREFTDHVPLTPGALLLPRMRGSGMVRDLSEAVSLDEDVAQALTSFSTAPTRDAQRDALDELVTEWAKSSTFWSSLEASLGGTVEILGLPDGMSEQDYRRLISVLEAFNGDRFYRVADATRPSTAGMTMVQGGGSGGGGSVGTKYILRPPAAQLALLLQSYEALKEGVYEALVAQTRLKPYLDSVEVTITQDGVVTLDSTALAAKLESFKQLNARDALIDLIELNRYAQPNLRVARFDGLGTLRTWIDALPAGAPLRLELGELGVYLGSAPSDQIRGGIYLGDASNNAIEAGDGNDILDSGAGNDTLMGGEGDDIYFGGAGNDTLTDSSLTSSDIYYFDRGGGIDTIRDSGGVDRIEIGVGIAPGELMVRQVQDVFGFGNIVLSLSTGEQLTIRSMFTEEGSLDVARAIEVIRFADGTAWDISRVKAEALKGTAGNDLLVGFSDDNLYRFERSEGVDVVSERGGVDVIEIEAGIASTDLKIRQARDIYGYGNLVLSLSTGEQLTIKAMFTESGELDTAQAIEIIRFADGTEWNIERIKQAALKGTNDDDLLVGFSGTDIYRLERGGGIDLISERGGLDVVEIGGGITPAELKIRQVRDIYGWDNLVLSLTTGEQLTIKAMFNEDGSLNTEQAIETIRFADGIEWDIDRIKAEAHTFRFERGSGVDVVQGRSGMDIIEVGTGIAPTDLAVRQVRDIYGVGNLVLSLATGEQLTIRSMFTEDGALDASRAIETIRFADGTEWDIERIKLEALKSTPGDDMLVGFAGNDVYRFERGGGMDVISERGGVDVIEIGEGIGHADVKIRQVRDVYGYDNLVLSLSTGEQLTIKAMFTEAGILNAAQAIDIIRFSDGSEWDLERLQAEAHAFRFDRGGGAEVIQGRDGMDVVSIGTGIAPEELKIRQVRDIYGYGNLVLSLSTGEQLTVKAMFTEDGSLDMSRAIDVIRFADGTEWNIERIKTEALKSTTGDDVLVGFAGNDIYRLERGGGMDVLSERGGVDTVEIGAEVTPADLRIRQVRDIYGAGNLVLGLNTGEQLTIKAMFTEGGVLTAAQAVEVIRFADGTEWDIERIKVEALKGTSSNDTLIGFSSDDIYRFERDGGVDIVSERGGVDVIELGADIAPTGLKIRQTQDPSGYGSLVLSLSTGEQLTIKSMFTENGALDAAQAIEIIRFADGTEWNIDRIKAEAIRGTTGNDALLGFNGADTFWGSAGNDELRGGGGGDTYLFERGWDLDTIVDYDTTAGASDTAQFGVDIAADQLWFSRSGNDLTVSLIGTSDQLKISNWYAASSYRVEAFRTSDGKVLLENQVQNLVDAMAAFSPPSAGQTTLPGNYQESLSTVIAVNWQ